MVRFAAALFLPWTIWAVRSFAPGPVLYDALIFSPAVLADKPGRFCGRGGYFIRGEGVFAWVPFRSRIRILHTERTADRTAFMPPDPFRRRGSKRMPPGTNPMVLHIAHKADGGGGDVSIPFCIPFCQQFRMECEQRICFLFAEGAGSRRMNLRRNAAFPYMSLIALPQNRL